MEYNPLEIIIRRPNGYTANGNYQQKITLITDKTEKEIRELIESLHEISDYGVITIDWYGRK